MVWAPWMGVLGKIICEDTMGQARQKYLLLAWGYLERGVFSLCS